MEHSRSFSRSRRWHLAWNAEGFWTPENDDVLTQVNRVASSGSPLMQQAKGIGTMAAAKRGLGNTSIAIQSAQDAVIGKAAEIGGKNAELINSKNLAQLQGKWDYKRSMDVAQLQESGATARTMAQIASQESMLGRELDSKERLALLDREAARDNLKLQLSADEKLAILNNAAALERTNVGEAGATQRQVLGDTAALDRTKYSADASLKQQQAADDAALIRQREEWANRTDISTADRDAELARLDKQIDANRANAVLESETRLNLGEMDRAQSSQNAALQASSNIQSAYIQGMSAIMANEKVPAEARAAAQQDMQRMSEANIGIIEDITNIDLAWGNNTKRDPTLPVSGAVTTQGDGVQRLDGGNGTYYLKDPAKGYWEQWGPNNTYLGQWTP